MESSIKQLRELSLIDNRKRYPLMPEYARSTRNYSDKTAGGLQRCIIDFLRFNGWQCERISVTGRYIDSSKIVEDCIGRSLRIGSGKWIPSSMQKGSSDLSAVIRGKAVKIEVKIGRDRQSEDQKIYQAEIERAGGEYWLIHSYSEFIDKYNKFLG